MKENWHLHVIRCKYFVLNNENNDKGIILTYFEHFDWNQYYACSSIIGILSLK